MAANMRLFRESGYIEGLSDPRLLRELAYIDGKWCAAEGGHWREVADPATGRRLGKVPAMGELETRRAIMAAQRAFAPWRALLPQQRSAILSEWGRLILAHKEDLARIMTLEQGKPLSEARGEVDYGAGFVQWFAEEGKRSYGETIPSHLPDRQLMTIRQPVGVTGAVTPWNFPLAMITRKAAAALAAGCPMVVRPALETPFTALALAELAERAGIPAGVLSVVTGDAQVIVGELCRNPTVRALSFTGSTEIGRLLLAQGAGTVKRMSMELGGHAPFIVFSDADLEAAVDGAVAAKFQTTGQDCLAANRIYVHESLYEDFLVRFAAKVRQLKVGPGLEEGVDQGPLIHDRALAKVDEQVRDARDKGARLLVGGQVHPRGGLFYQPTVLADVTPQMQIYREETFGPVAAVLPFADETTVLVDANDSEYGLAAYVYARDLGRIWRSVGALDYGMVAVNCVKMTGSPIPFGGVKQSGLGREGGRQGLEEFLETKYVCLGGLGS